jgi:hypothetical protein
MKPRVWPRIDNLKKSKICLAVNSTSETETADFAGSFLDSGRFLSTLTTLRSVLGKKIPSTFEKIDKGFVPIRF